MQGYDSFLLRHWQLKDGTYRVAIEHIQSGERGAVASLGAALAWITMRSGGPNDDAPDDPTGSRCGRDPADRDRVPP